MKKEIRVWEKLVHPNVLPLHGLCWLRGDSSSIQVPSLVSPWMLGGSLRSYLAKCDEEFPVASMDFYRYVRAPLQSTRGIIRLGARL